MSFEVSQISVKCVKLFGKLSKCGGCSMSSVICVMVSGRLSKFVGIPAAYNFFTEFGM